MTRLSITLSTRTPLDAVKAEALRLQLSSTVAFTDVKQEVLTEDTAVFSVIDALPGGGAASRMYQHDAVHHAAQVARADVIKVRVDR